MKKYILPVIILLIISTGVWYYIFNFKSFNVSDTNTTVYSEFSLEKEKVEILSPSTDDVLRWDREHKIRWTYNGDEKLDIVLQPTNLQEVDVSPKIIAKNVTNTGEYNWKVTHEFPSWTYRIEIFPEEFPEFVGKSESFQISYSDQDEMEKTGEVLDLDDNSRPDTYHVSVPVDPKREYNAVSCDDGNSSVGCYDQSVSNIIGYNKTIGITMSIPAGVTPSEIEDLSLGEVIAYRFQDNLSGKENDVYAIFSCFQPGLPKLKNISFVDINKSYESKNIDLDGKNYYIQDFGDFFFLFDTDYKDYFNDLYNIYGCGVVLVGKELSEVHTSFLNHLSYIDDRETYIRKIYNKFIELY